MNNHLILRVFNFSKDIQRWLALLACSLVSHDSLAIDFSHQIVPILRKHCSKCHADLEAKGGFSFNTKSLILESGAVESGDSDASYLMELISSTDPEQQMPPPEFDRVSDDELQLLSKWIDEDLPWTDGFSFAKTTFQPSLSLRKVEIDLDSVQHPIDQLIAQQTNASPKNPPASDHEFVRRASLDLVGLLPSLDDLKRFQLNKSDAKRAELIDDLLSRDIDYAEHWLTFWNDLLRNDYTGTGFITGGRTQITDWLYRSLIKNKPYDQMVRELISPRSSTSSGFAAGIEWRGEVSAGQTIPIQFSQSVCQSFLGINMKCASCHDSFVDQWKLSDAYAIAAIYAEEPLELHRCDKPTGIMAEPRWLYPDLGSIDPQANKSTRLDQLGERMTDDRNAAFSRTIVNRIWAQLFGHGIVEPVDAMHLEPWNQDLLDYLASRLTDSDYDLKHLIRLITTSQAYGSRVLPDGVTESASLDHSQRGVSADQWVGPRSKRMTAEQFIDAVWTLTNQAPRRWDAPVLRGSMGSTETDHAVSGQWISATEDQKSNPKDGKSFAFRKNFKVTERMHSAAWVIASKEPWSVYLDRKHVVSVYENDQVQTIPIHDRLTKGQHEVVIMFRGTSDAGDVSLFFEMHQPENATDTPIQSDSSWQVSLTNKPSRREGRIGKINGPWESASIGNSPSDLDVHRAVVQSHQLVNQPRRSSRAALMKNDDLMLALGRPNRDQIVTSRPSQLTMLESVFLANHQVLASTLRKGAESLLASSPQTTEKLVEDIFLKAYSRQPTESESALFVSELGDQPSLESVEDLLWIVCMTPEFLLIR